MFSMRLFFGLFSCLSLFVFTPNILLAQEQESIGLRYYVGAKLGYSGANVTDITNKTTGKNANSYDDFLSSLAISIHAGGQYALNSSFALRTELEYTYRFEGDSTKNNGYRYYGLTTAAPPNVSLQDAYGPTTLSIEAHTILANLYLDYYITPKFSMYAGAGIGISLVEASTDAFSPDFYLDDLYPEVDTEKMSVDFAWQVGVGVRYAITENILIDANVRYTGLSISGKTLGNAQLLSMEYGAIGAVEALVGASYLF